MRSALAHHASALLASMLRTAGFRQIMIVLNARAFAQEIGKGGYGIAFLGDQQTSTDAKALVRGIRGGEARSGFYTPIVMLFSDTAQRHILAACDAGVTDFIRKPVSPAILAVRIEQLFTGPQKDVASVMYNGRTQRRRVAPYNGGDRRGE